jgi:hypothetical protein
MEKYKRKGAITSASFHNYFSLNSHYKKTQILWRPKVVYNKEKTSESLKLLAVNWWPKTFRKSPVGKCFECQNRHKMKWQIS